MNRLKIYSFDVFDTLVTRQFVDPHYIFQEAGKRLADLGFESQFTSNYRTLRVSAERAVRSHSGGQEITLDQILEEVIRASKLLPTDIVNLREVEISTEIEFAIKVPAGIQLLESARQVADQIIFLSDMYLPTETVEKILSKLEIKTADDIVYVSSEFGSSKHTGSLYRDVAAKFNPQASFIHIGDNYKSDVLQAREAGWTATHFKSAIPNKYENIAHKYEENENLQSFTGELRRRRLDYDGPQLTMYILGLQVLGPLLFVYVYKLLEWCNKENIDHIFCLSRDTQALLEVLDTFASFGFNVPKYTYLYISRKSLRMPEFFINGQECPKWIFEESGELTIGVIFKRLDLDIQEWWPWLSQNGWSSCNENKKIGLKEKAIVTEWLNQGDLRIAFKKKCAEQHRLINEYFDNSGLLTSNKPLVCDVGWTGSSFKALRTILGVLNHKQVLHGYYFGMKSPPRHVQSLLAADSELWHQDCFYEIIETLLSADHGGVHSYSMTPSGVRPVLHEEKNIVAIERGLLQLRSGCISTIVAGCRQTKLADNILDIEVIQQMAERSYHLLLSQPTTDEAIAIGDWPISIDSTHDNLAPMAPKLSLVATLHTMVNAHRRHRKYWHKAIKLRNGNLIFMALRLTDFTLNLSRRVKRRLETTQF